MRLALYHLCDYSKKKNVDLIRQPIPKTDLELICKQSFHSKQNPMHVWSFLGLTRLLSAFTADTPQCTRSHYQVNVGTYHSSQLTPIYPRAFTSARLKTEGVMPRLCNAAGSRGSKHSHGWEAKGSALTHNAVQPNEIMQIKL